MKKSILFFASGIFMMQSANSFAQGIQATISGSTNVSCYGQCNGTATASQTGGYNPYTYLWTPGGATTKTASGLCAGSYTVTVKDSTGFTGTGVATVAITEPPALSLTAPQTASVTCNGGTNGSATVTALGGTPVYFYAWSPAGGNTPTANNLAAGIYTVTVTDANGCIKQATATITQPNVITASITSTNVTCNGGNNGTATVIPLGGTPGYTFSWSTSPVQNTQTATGLSAGSYYATATDANGCTKQSSATITQPLPINISVSASSYCVMTPTQLIPSGTTTFHWSPSAGLSCTTCANPTANPSVTSTYTLTDANGCGAAFITVNVNTASYPQICISTVDTTSAHNIIVWEKPGSQGTIASFRIYRETASGFTPIVTLPYSHISMYTDTASSVNPNLSSYKYRISTISTTSVESALSNVHETMFLKVTQSAPPVANLTWTDYCGFPVTKYYIYRDAYNTNNWVKIDSANWGTNVYVDPAAPTASSRYKIETLPQHSCTASLKISDINTIALNSSRSNVYRINNANSVNEISLNDLVSIYPNPANGKFNLKMDQFEDLKMKELKVYNVYGECIYRSANFQINSSSNCLIDLSTAKSGIYFLQLKTEQGTAVKKIIKE